jgi:hypothetical protein
MQRGLRGAQPRRPTAPVSIKWWAEPARHIVDCRGHNRCRDRQLQTIWSSRAIDEISWPDAIGALFGRKGQTRPNHQDRQPACTAHACRSQLGLPAQSPHQPTVAQAPRDSAAEHSRHRLESASTLVRAIPTFLGKRQSQTSDHNDYRQKAMWLYLGDRRRN